MIKITLFFNSQNGNANAPYFTGKLVMEDGTEYKASLWTNVSAAGTTYYNGNAKPFEPKAAAPAPVQEPAQTAPVQPEPATADFIKETLEEWYARTKADIPDLGRRRLDPPRDAQATNAFYKRLKYDESLALIRTIGNTPIDQMTEDMVSRYTEASVYVNQYQTENQDLFPGTKI
jgi:hypothetical protein